jgi:hypothetical protein
MLAVYRPSHTRIFQEATATYDYLLNAFNKLGVKEWLFSIYTSWYPQVHGPRGFGYGASPTLVSGSGYSEESSR